MRRQIIEMKDFCSENRTGTCGDWYDVFLRERVNLQCTPVLEKGFSYNC